MKYSFKLSLPIALALILVSLNTFSSSNDSVQEDKDTVNQWNNFVKNIYQLHLNQTKKADIKTTKRSGSYYRLPDFFQEVKYFDTKDNTLLSRIEWESRNPENIHSIEVFVRDKDNRIIREYSASFLPKYRNAPYQTLINLHYYQDSIHSYRQFDASDNLIYEVCTVSNSKEKIYEHDDYEIPDNLNSGIGSEEAYQNCFKQLPRTAGLYIKPH